ncbi:metalloregulator ArsR/SmtB family transcription factor [soil metagenome]
MPTHPVIDPDILRRAAAQAVGVLKLLANENRLLLLCQLSQGEMCVSELEQLLDIRQPTLSQQLGLLRNEGVVNTRRQGKNIYYSMVDPALLEIVAMLYRLYCHQEA